jgi:DNA-binding MarR family transcriptional regulator
MSTPEPGNSRVRDDLVAAILRVTADVTARKVAYSASVAERLGLAGPDVDVLAALAAEGPMPVGRIGELTGLTTGATTRMVDRLEQAGFVRRVPDPADRRRVMVEPAGDRAGAVVRAYEPIEEAGRRALDALDIPALEAVHAYLAAFAAAIPSDASGGESPGHGPDASTSAGAPIASATAGRLVFVTGAPSVTIGAAADLGSELYRARFSGATPSARVRDGAVTIRYPKFAWFDWRVRVADQFMNASAHWKRDRTELVLNALLPWSIELRGGATSVSADLRGLRLGAFDLSGGAGSVNVTLGPARGIVPVRVRGGAGDVLVTRPAGTATTLVIRGGYRKATLDGTAAWSPGQIATPDAANAPDRYEIEVAGGANRVTVREG